MKKTLFFLLLLIVGFEVWFFLKKEPQSQAPLPITAINQPASQQQETNPTVATFDTNNIAIVIHSAKTSLSSPQIPSPIIILEQTNELASTNSTSELVLSNYQTLDDLTQIKSLREINGFLYYRNWYSEGNLVAFQLKTVSGQLIAFKTDTMWALTDKKDNHVHELILHSPWLDIDGVRQVGLELEKAWGLDPTDFLAWCNKVGNNWIDAPLYSAGNGFPPAPAPYIGFGVHRTTNNEKPWVIILTIHDKR